MSGDTSEPQADLIELLRSDQGAAHRSEILQRMDELEARVKASLRAGQHKSDFENLQAVLLAITHGRDTLQKLNLQGSNSSQSPFQGPLGATTRNGIDPLGESKTKP